MFERLHDSGLPIVQLRTQYRCHPHIGSLANKLFYQGQLTNGTPASKLSQLIEGFPPLCFVNIKDGREEWKLGSYCNIREADFIVSLVSQLTSRGISASDMYRQTFSLTLTYSGVVALYKTQVGYIEQRFRTLGLKVQTSSVDAFQGGEKMIIILSTVRSKSVGFIDDSRRVNVAVTRAKRHLVIAGNASLLESNKLWREIVNTCSGVYPLAYYHLSSQLWKNG